MSRLTPRRPFACHPQQQARRTSCTWCGAAAPFPRCLIHRSRPIPLVVRQGCPLHAPVHTQAIRLRGREPGPARRSLLALLAWLTVGVATAWRALVTLIRTLTLSGGH
jgi:hypothetical protein